MHLPEYDFPNPYPDPNPNPVLGAVQTAQTHLEKALEVAAGAGCGVTDWEVSEHHFKLGRVLWVIGGEAKSDPEQVRLAAALPLCQLLIISHVRAVCHDERSCVSYPSLRMSELCVMMREAYPSSPSYKSRDLPFPDGCDTWACCRFSRNCRRWRRVVPANAAV